MKRKIGILGGTFDPPHIGHLIIAEEVRLELDLEEVWFIPTYTPPHKTDAMTTAKERATMTKLAISGNPHFKVNTIEVERSGKSYTVDTMRTLTENHPDCQFYFIIGGDMVAYLPKWERIDELVALVQFVGVKRAGYSLESEYDILKVDIPLIDISSTMLRSWLKAKRSAKYIVPDAVHSFIKGENLYGYKESD